MEVKINKFERWRKVVGIRPRHELPSLTGREVRYLEEQLLLEDEIAVSPKNKNIEIRRANFYSTLKR